ncbi:DUF3800 domain-containing protein [Candidatus Peregrinibacteria bacterium]|nr:DUF3800 domain-containing protein [Candidatus Peregrinibacteria bacterium]
MSAMQKLTCYVDETGQDTSGEFFLVSIVILDHKREELKEWLKKLEKESGKGQKKWTKATRKQRKAYMEQIVTDERFSELIYYSHYTDSRSYVDLTILSTAKAILEKARGHTMQKFTLMDCRRVSGVHSRQVCEDCTCMWILCVASRMRLMNSSVSATPSQGFSAIVWKVTPTCKSSIAAQ